MKVTNRNGGYTSTIQIESNDLCCTICVHHKNYIEFAGDCFQPIILKMIYNDGIHILVLREYNIEIDCHKLILVCEDKAHGFKRTSFNLRQDFKIDNFISKKFVECQTCNHILNKDVCVTCNRDKYEYVISF